MTLAAHDSNSTSNEGENQDDSNNNTSNVRVSGRSGYPQVLTYSYFQTCRSASLHK